MVVPENIRTQAGREATFLQSHHLSKRRASNTKKKTPTAVTWPHDSPTPPELARAGFYYNPSANSVDNVTCFLCDYSLDGWEPSDNPAFEHAHHSPNCGWAINICINERSGNKDREEEDPLSERMIEARTATFMQNWPHDEKRGWKCKTKKMVDAGWCFCPTPESEDYATCFYCGLSLDGWEPKDDPMQEHLRRSSDCYFFTLIKEAGSKNKPIAGKKGRSKGLKNSRLSSQSDVTHVSEAPSMLSLEGDMTTRSEDSIMTDATNVTVSSVTGKGLKKRSRAKAGTKGKRKLVRAKKSVDTESAMGADDHIPQAVRLSSMNDSLILLQEPGKTSTVNRAHSSGAEGSSSQLPDLSLDDVVPKKPTRPKRAGKAKKAAQTQTATRLSEDQSQLQIELQAEIIPSTSTRPARGTKRASNGEAKTSSDAVQEGAAPNGIQGQEPFQQPERETEAEDEPVLHSDPVILPEQVFSPSDILSSPVDQSTPRLVPEQPPQALQYLHAGKFATSSPTVSRISPQQPQPTASPPRQPQQQPEKVTEGRASVSPAQSSDAENQPPSSRTNLIRIPLPPMTPSKSATTFLSPSKRTLNPAALRSAERWTAIDLETVFLPSPAHPEKTSLPLYASGGVGLADKNFENLGTAMAALKDVLTSPEKKMSVEEWVRSNARRAEEMFRTECERVVGVFERQGGRAMGSVGGVEVEG